MFHDTIKCAMNVSVNKQLMQWNYKIFLGFISIYFFFFCKNIKYLCHPKPNLYCKISKQKNKLDLEIKDFKKILSTPLKST